MSALIAVVVLTLTGAAICEQHDHPIDVSTNASMAAEAFGGDCHSPPDQVAAQPDDLLAVSAPKPATDNYASHPTMADVPGVVVADGKRQPPTLTGSARLSLLGISRT